MLAILLSLYRQPEPGEQLSQVQDGSEALGL
jgi:hypothetical protein